MTQPPATLEQADRLQELLGQWDDKLRSFRRFPELPREVARELNGSRRVLENYRRVLRTDLAAGIERVPTGELRRAIGTAEASLKQLSGLEATLSSTPVQTPRKG